MSTETKEAKKELRKAITAKLAALSEDDVATQSRRVQQSIISLPQYQNANRLSIYLSMPTGEARTDMIVRDALSNGKKVFVPYLYSIPDEASKKGKVMDMLRLSSVEEFDGLRRDSWGIPYLPKGSIELRENAIGGHGTSFAADRAESAKFGSEQHRLDLIVVPGVAFDACMGRLGHGAGYYDSYISRIRSGGDGLKPFLVAACLAEQMLPAGQVPMQELDWRMNAIAVGDGTLVTLGKP